MLSNNDNKSMKLDITADEISSLKKIFIRRIVNKWNEKYDIEPKDVIIEIDLKKEELNIFINDIKDKVLKFDY
jgi:hypothetical protein